MKKIITAIIAVAALFVATPSQAQTSFGLKGGLNVTNMTLSNDLLDASNRAGFFIGPTVKFTLPIVGLGVDAAVLYDQREAELADTKITQRSVNIPINARYTIGLGDMAGIYLAAGPQFGFNVGDTDFSIAGITSGTSFENYTLKKSNFSINVGGGVQLMSHLEIGVTYNIALGKTGEASLLGTTGDAISSVFKTNNNAWQVSAAYYF
ncbi:MAG: porin family protein [Prevotella sp.]|nr:porin family protein [Prevotella sp.]